MAALKRYRDKALAPGAIGKIIRDPAIVARTIRTLATNRNLREVPPEELLRDADAAIHALARLAPKLDQGSFNAWLPVRMTPDVRELGELFRIHGSDKSTDNDYFEVYGSLLNRNKPLRILEIGLGTNNLAFQSNMGLGGKPGASLRAFRDWAPKSEVFGADIDRGVLFEEDRIKTFFVDQTEPETLRELAAQVGTGFDLIIDDGLHLPHANLNTIEALLPLLKPGGTMVIEDILPPYLNYWQAASAVLGEYDTCLTERRCAHIFVIRPSAVS
jgi:SAM-dependent methyltransferase